MVYNRDDWDERGDMQDVQTICKAKKNRGRNAQAYKCICLPFFALEKHTRHPIPLHLLMIIPVQTVSAVDYYQLLVQGPASKG